MSKYRASDYGFTMPENKKPYGMAYTRYAKYYNVDSAFRQGPAFYYRMAKVRLETIISLKRENIELEGIKNFLDKQRIIRDTFSADDLDEYVTQLFENITSNEVTDNILDSFDKKIHQQYGEIQDANNNEDRMIKLESLLGEFRNIFGEAEKIDEKQARQSINKFLQTFGKQGMSLNENYNGDLSRIIGALESFYSKLQAVQSIYTKNPNITNFNQYAQKDISRKRSVKTQQDQARILHNQGIISKKQYAELNKYFNAGDKITSNTQLETFSSGRSLKQLMGGCYALLLGEFCELALYIGLDQQINKVQKEITNTLDKAIVTKIDHVGGDLIRGGTDIRATLTLDTKDKQVKDLQGNTVKQINLPIGFNVKAYTKEEQLSSGYKRFINMNFSDWIRAVNKTEAIWTFIHIAQLGFNEAHHDKLSAKEQLNTYAINAYITSFHYQEIFGIKDNIRYIVFKTKPINIYDFIRDDIVGENRFPVYQIGRSAKFRELADFGSAPIAFRQETGVGGEG